MARYNQRMNSNLYSAASQLDMDCLTADKGAFFGSVLGTLNHILVGDIIWLKRFAGHKEQFSSLNYARELPYPSALSAIVHPELDTLAKARETLDQVIIEFTIEASDESYKQSLSYKNTKGQSSVKNFGQLVQHLFNHQTHHRGQVSTLLSQEDIDVGVTDLLLEIPESSML